ncbi:serine hydrolase [Telluribacter sp. SYSU D00476]|uniref:serine hydrolase domain-containing protein n=1 Tax=Telluribacter sp. SYSU D00476 TaxID=2811430 RepID=UPI001FF5BD28|nr:serine hydrolase [Telluribacter sp. SYSU D00476]
MRRISYVAGFVLLACLLISALPRVWYRESPYGSELPRRALLPAQVQDQLKAYVRDTSHYAESQQVVAIHNEEIVFEEGDVKRLINCHSARKSIMSLLIGIAREKGFLRLDESLGQLGIDESKTPLTPQEKSATIRDLLMARSGVYLPAEAETDFAKANRPRREQYKPGEFFFYNNFDFNVLGAILEQKTGRSIGEFMEEYLARPLEMQDFSASHVVYGNPWPVRDDKSDYRVYWMYLSARDLARVGAMVAQRGLWKGKQVVSAEWIRESTGAYTTTLDESMWPFDGYGYLWWMDKDNNTIWADGYGGQFLLIDTTRNLAIAQRNFTGNSLLTSGLFMIRKRKRHGGRVHLMHIYDLIKGYVDEDK